jgi:ribosomal-protein-alanine N-acetyltransferase
MMRPVRAGTLGDLPHIANLHGECFDDAWDIEFLRCLLAQPGAFSAVVMDQDVLAGFVLARANAGEAEILSLGVGAPWRRRALATALVRTMLERASGAGAVEVFLEVAVDNIPARALYGALGFREVGLRPAYYGRGGRPGTDALILRRALPFEAGCAGAGNSTTIGP